MTLAKFESKPSIELRMKMKRITWNWRVSCAKLLKEECRPVRKFWGVSCLGPVPFDGNSHWSLTKPLDEPLIGSFYMVLTIVY